MNLEKIQNTFFFIALFVSIGFFLYILYPFLTALSIAATLAIIFRPLHRDVLRSTNYHESWAATITLIMVFIIVAVPIGFALTNIFNQIQQIYNGYLTTADNQSAANFSNLSSNLQVIKDRYLPWLVVNFESLKTQLVSWLFGNLSNIFSSVVKIAFDIVIVLMALFFLFRDGHRFKEKLIKMSPLKDDEMAILIRKIEQTINSVIRGSLLIAVIQGTLTGIGFAIFNIPQPLLWGTVAAVAALLPTFGTAIITFPAFLYLLATGQYWMAVGLAVWSVVLIHSIDNFLGPVLKGKGMKVHSFLIFLSVLGGMEFFGAIGFIVGPIILSITFTLLEIYASLAAKNEKTA